jgi:hypothetical protein
VNLHNVWLQQVDDNLHVKRQHPNGLSSDVALVVPGGTFSFHDGYAKVTIENTKAAT